MKTWNIDIAHSEIGFKVKHLMISTVKGVFTSFEGIISAEDETFDNASVSFSADVKSLTTKNEGRDNHIHSSDFFDEINFPKITFISNSVKAKGDGNLEITGDLTMKGVSKSISLDGKLTGIGNDLYGGHVAAFEVHGVINRQDFGVSWNATLDTGGVAVSDNVTLEIIIEAKEVK
jgi:polyisoprenoid-binding protein YceI